MAELSLTDSFNEEMAVILDAEVETAETFINCGNCCNTATSMIDRNNLVALRDFLNEHVK